MRSYLHNILTIIGLLWGWALFAQTVPENAPPVKVDVKNETAVNTIGLEFSPTFFEDGIVFVSTNTEISKKQKVDQQQEMMMSILRSRRNAEGLLQAPEVFAQELNSINNHEGPVCFDRTAETVYFSSNSVIEGKDQFAKDKVQHTRIYASKKENGVWGAPVPLSFNNGEFDDFHPAISIDGDKLFFASNRPGSMGSTDIYVSYKVSDSWSEPVNLGPTVNTTGRDAFPFIHADNTLYFASDGQPDRKGGFDLFYSIPEENQWTKPINLGEPFNTAGDDIGLIVDLNKINGYYSTNGSGGAGGDEIVSFHTEFGNLDDYLLQNKRVPDRNLDLKVVVTDKTTGSPIKEAEVQVLNYDGANVIGRDEQGNLITVQTIDGKEVIGSMPPDKGINGETDSKGRFRTDLKPGNYVVIITKKGYQTKQIRLPISKPGNELAAQLEKTSLAIGKIQWIPTVFNYTTNAPLAGATLILTDKDGKKDTLITDVNGTLEHYINPESKYKVDILQAGRIIGSTEVNSIGWPDISKPMYQNISVAPLMPGSAIELPNIYYNFNDATLRPDARKDLDLVVALLKQQTNVTVELRSHTDSRGTNAYNQDLSQRRANGVVEYLIAKGIGRNRLIPVGLGESELHNNCRDGAKCTEQEHARNRRTEVRMVTGMNGGSMVYVDGKLVNGAQSDTGNANVNVPPVGTVQVTNAESDTYYVISGSFLMEARATAQLARIKSKGFAQAEIVRFPNSNFYSVCVSKFKTREEASTLKRKLDKEKVDAFVRAVQ